MKRPAVNISTPERVGRMVLGGAAAIAGAVLVGGAGSALVAKVGHVPRSLRSAS